MAEEICDICGYRSYLGAVQKHQIIPGNITCAANVSEPQTIKMCYNCRRELDMWYSIKIVEMTFDAKVPCYRYKTPLELLEHYRKVFAGFKNHKKS